MKNIQFLFFLLSNITVHAMQLDLVASHENVTDAKQIIKGDFRDYLAHRLHEYTKTSFSNDDIHDIQKKYSEITNKENLSFLSKCLHRDVCDAEGNNFVHMAVQYKHVAMTKWLMDCMKHPLSTSNKAGKEPIDICIDQLMPQSDEKNKEDVYKVFTLLIDSYDKIGFDDNHRRNFLKKIITLEFEHIKQASSFTLPEDVLKRFGGQNVPEIYQEIGDENGNTFTHVLVQLHCADLLYKFIEKKYVTFSENNNNQSPLDVALKLLKGVSAKLFQSCTQNKDFNVSAIAKEDTDKKCCYFMLSNLSKKQEGSTNFKQCCGKHII